MQTTVRGGHDTFALAAKPDAERGEARYLSIGAALAEAFLFMRNPAPRGASVSSGMLYVKARGASSGVRTLTLQRISEPWKAGRLTWNKRPGVTGTTVTANVDVLADGDEIAFDVTALLQAVVDGDAHYGWKITSSAAVIHRLYGLDAGTNRPRLVVEWSDAPGVPTDQTPSGGQAVSVDKPVLAFTYSDVTDDALTTDRKSVV